MSNVLAMDPTVKLKWSPKIDNDLPEDERFVIIYNHLDMRKAAVVDDEQIRSIQKGKKTSEFKYLVGQADVKRLELSITGWENFIYPKGHPDADKPVPFAPSNITLIPPEIRREFVNFLTGRDREAEEDEGTDLGEATTA